MKNQKEITGFNYIQKSTVNNNESLHNEEVTSEDLTYKHYKIEINSVLGNNKPGISNLNSDLDSKKIVLFTPTERKICETSERMETIDLGPNIRNTEVDNNTETEKSQCANDNDIEMPQVANNKIENKKKKTCFRNCSYFLRNLFKFSQKSYYTRDNEDINENNEEITKKNKKVIDFNVNINDDFFEQEERKSSESAEGDGCESPDDSSDDSSDEHYSSNDSDENM